jgi:isopropylmalate/homocitrate/citramalate synthase
MQPDDVLAQAVDSVKIARRFTDNVEFSPEDAGRSETDFLCRIIEAVIDAGATTINIPDTVGYNIPHQFGTLIRTLLERIPNSDKAVFSVHCHNDLGLAVGNSLAAVLNGARQVECTINGLGERAGNASLEEIVMAVRTRQDVFSVLVMPHWKKLSWLCVPVRMFLAVIPILIPHKLFHVQNLSQVLLVFRCNLIKRLSGSMPLPMNRESIRMVF